MTTQDVVNFYAALLILQYSGAPHAVATVQAYIDRLIQNQIIDQVRNGFDLETAIGKQLTILGTYRGALRVLFGAVPGQDWSLVPYLDPNPNSYLGLALYTDPDPTWNWIQYHDVDSLAYSLSDQQLRRLIKLRAQLHKSQMGLGDLDQILYSFFGVYVNLVDNQNMTMIYQHKTIDPDTGKLWSLALLSASLPHPAGVLATTAEV